MVFKKTNDFRLISLKAFDELDWNELVRAADITEIEFLRSRKYKNLTLFAIVANDGLPIWSVTRFLVYCSVTSKGVTEDRQRTYGESLIPWLRFLREVEISIDSADEETLQLFRARLAHSIGRDDASTATATVNLRIAVVSEFYRWCERNGYGSPLGEFLNSRENRSRSLSMRIVKRHPRVLSEEEISRLFRYLENPYRLAFRWAIVTGIRRMEVASLLQSNLPEPTAIPFFDDGLGRISIRRKGGKETTVYVPISLLEETYWYVLSERGKPAEAQYNNHIFLNRDGRPLSKWALSTKFREAANHIGSDATLHHLRHTYAVNIVRFLNKKSKEEGINVLKTLQTLMGHASSATTEIYLSAMKMSSPAVTESLDYLYGASL